MPLTPKELEYFEERFSDLLLKSHQSMAEGSSKFWGEMKIDVAVIKETLQNIKTNQDGIKNDIKENYVPQTEFKPVRALVYGCVGLILLSVVGAGLTFVIMKAKAVTPTAVAETKLYEQQ